MCVLGLHLRVCVCVYVSTRTFAPDIGGTVRARNLAYFNILRNFSRAAAPENYKLVLPFVESKFPVVNLRPKPGTHSKHISCETEKFDAIAR